MRFESKDSFYSWIQVCKDNGKIEYNCSGDSCNHKQEWWLTRENKKTGEINNCVVPRIIPITKKGE